VDENPVSKKEESLMTRLVTRSVRLVPGAQDLGLLHDKAIPQKDQLCGAFWGALVLTAAGHPIDQDEVALRSGTTLAQGDPEEWLPPGTQARTDYETSLPVAADGAASGTSAPALARSIEGLSGGDLAVVPVAGPWSAASVVELVETVAATTTWCTLIANIRTGHLWGSRPPARLLLDHLAGRAVEEPPRPDWDCGHFLTIVACLGETFLALRDTYPQLGWGGYHLQPAGAVAAALERGDGSEGGVLCVCGASVSEVLAGRLGEMGFVLRHWDNGTPDPGRER
jgi:hypothetical protein